MHKQLFAIVFLFFSFPCLTQTIQVPPVKKTDGSVSSYADEAAVIERADVVYRYASDGTGTKVETGVVRVQSSAAVQNLGILTFPYASATQSLDISYVRVRKPDGSMVETPAVDAHDQPAPVTQIAPMYSDLRMKQVPVRSLAVGDKLEFETRMTQRQPEIAGEFWGQENFGAGAVFLERSIELHVPKQKQVTVYSPDHAPGISEAGGERVYRWKGSQLRSPSAKDDDSASAVKTPPIAWTTFPSWEAVGLWYRRLSTGRDAVTPVIQAKADEITANAKTDTDKVRALYEYVSSHNHYIGIDFGIGRYQPHTAAEVMTNQYGDCKDKHTLLAALLRAKGFEVSAVLISAGIELNEKVPMPAAFNHVITQVQVGNEKLWLDATTEVAPYRMLLPLLRDKEVLVVPAAGAPGLEKTPARLPFVAETHYEAKSELDKNGSLKGHFYVMMRGDNELLMRLAERQIARTQWDQLSQIYANGSGFSGTTSGTLLDAAEDTSKPWQMHYDYTQTAASDFTTFYHFASMLPNLNLPTVDENRPPKQKIELGAPYTFLATSTIVLPAKYTVNLPNVVRVKSRYGDFEKTYELKEGSLVSSFRLQTLMDSVPATEWREYKKFLDDIGQEPWIELRSKVFTPGEEFGLFVAGPYNQTSNSLVREAWSAVQTHNLELARKKLTEAAAINDKERSLPSLLGYINAVDGNYAEAEKYYRLEMTLYPDDSDSYPALIDMERRLGEKEAERETLIAYAKAWPKGIKANFAAGQGLLANGYVEDAVEVYRAAARAIPENKQFQVSLGNALLRAGKTDEAVALMKNVLQGSSNAAVLNSGAYVLASHHAELPLAESSAKKAVEVLEAESAKMSLESVNARSFGRINLLLATWDTLGWVYFEEGNMELAEKYVGAAWKNSHAPEMGLHMGQIMEKRGDRAGALTTYEMALARWRGSATNPDTKELQTRADGLKEDGVTSPGKADLQEQRTYHIARSPALKGSAIFHLQVSATKTEKMEFVSGDDELRQQSEVLAHLDLGLGIPKGSQALLLRSGVLFCGTAVTCDFVLTPPENVDIK